MIIIIMLMMMMMMMRSVIILSAVNEKLNSLIKEGGWEAKGKRNIFPLFVSHSS